MTELLSQYGPHGAALVILAGVIGTLATALVRQRRHAHGDWDGRERRAAPPSITVDLSALGEHLRPLVDVRKELKELHEEVRETRHGIRTELQPLVVRQAVIEERVTRLEHDLEKRGR